MIATLLTDAQCEPSDLDRALRSAVERSFHRISIDGDTSTNDAAFAMASGKAGRFPQNVLEQAMIAVARELALMVIRDGEGARKLIHVRVIEARTDSDALQIAQTVAGSLLVRTAVTGGDPNWGRILAAIGRSGVEIDIARIRILANDVPLFANGAPADSLLADRQEAFRSQTVTITIHLGQGQGSDEFFTCDLTEGYIHVNSNYMT
jgi:glutamate N-acetyltransferase / amino-acid N-acetyltransferase